MVWRITWRQQSQITRQHIQVFRRIETARLFLRNARPDIFRNL
jgi:hypothetical protein